MNKLMGCPFCGWHQPSLKDAGMQRYQIQCPGCGGSGGICKEITAAVRQWNARADNQTKTEENVPGYNACEHELKRYGFNAKNGVIESMDDPSKTSDGL